MEVGNTQVLSFTKRNINMTTVAYSHELKQIAVDGRVSAGSLISCDTYDKTRKRDGLIFICAGLVADIDILVESYPYGYEGMDELEASALVIDEGKVYQCAVHDKKYFVTPIDFDITMGSGGDFALAAMDLLGATPKEAVKYAMKRDMATGGKIQVIKVK